MTLSGERSISALSGQLYGSINQAPLRRPMAPYNKLSKTSAATGSSCPPCISASISAAMQPGSLPRLCKLDEQWKFTPEETVCCPGFSDGRKPALKRQKRLPSRRNAVVQAKRTGSEH